MGPVKVVIEMRDGVLVSVMSGSPLYLVVIDHDRPGDAFGRMFQDDTLVSEFKNWPTAKEQL